MLDRGAHHRGHLRKMQGLLQRAARRLGGEEPPTAREQERIPEGVPMRPRESSSELVDAAREDVEIAKVGVALGAGQLDGLLRQALFLENLCISQHCVLLTIGDLERHLAELERELSDLSLELLVCARDVLPRADLRVKACLSVTHHPIALREALRCRLKVLGEQIVPFLEFPAAGAHRLQTLTKRTILRLELFVAAPARSRA